ncbi:MAG: hypothetical protein NTZ74_04845 [Chloroflexi bacterium]|nr:hypothetical protein [Chloroflexota bacterium]
MNRSEAAHSADVRGRESASAGGASSTNFLSPINGSRLKTQLD